MPVAIALFEGERLVAAAPAYLKNGSEGEFVFDWSWADLAHKMGLRYYPKLVVAVPFTPATGDRLLVAPGLDRARTAATFVRVAQELARENLISGAHVLFPREEEARGWENAGMMRRAGVQFHWHNRGYKTWDDYLSTFTSKRRNQLKRESSQPAKEGVTIETVPQRAIDAGLADTMHALYATTVDKFRWGRRYLNARFFRLVAERFTDRLAWVVAKKDGRVVAGAFNVKKGDRLYGRYWGGHVDLPFLHFNVCYYHGIREAIDGGLTTFEPGAGGEHKKARGFEPTTTHSAHWLRDPKLSSIVGEFLSRERAAVEAFVRGDGADPDDI